MGTCLGSQNEFAKYDYYNTLTFFQNSCKLVARVVDIYDGDTCTVIVKYYNRYIKVVVRLYGIDTCEIKSQSEVNKLLAYQSRERLYELVTNKKLVDKMCTRTEIRKLLNESVYLVTLETYGLDKYGRLLVTMYKLDVSKNSFSDILLSEKLAYKYYGRTKLSEKEQSQLLNRYTM